MFVSKMTGEDYENMNILAQLLDMCRYGANDDHKVRDAMHYLLASLGFSYIAGGSFKQTYGSDMYPFVVKIFTWKAPESGACELENYRTAPAHLKDCLVPVLRQTDYYQLQERVPILPCSVRSCYVPDMWDSDNRNHTHAADGSFVIFDYGQDEQWARTAA